MRARFSFGSLVLFAALTAACQVPPAPLTPDSVASPSSVAGSPVPGPSPVLAPSPVASPSPRPAAAQLRIGYTDAGLADLPVFVAQEQGLFARYGLQTTLSLQSPDDAVAAEQQGTIPISILSQDAVIAADLKRGDLGIYASGPNRALYGIYSLASITTLDQLSGKRLGVTATGSTSELIARYVLDLHNLQPDKDVTVVPVGDEQSLLSSVQAGGVDAAVVPLADGASLAAGGLREILDVSQEDLPYYPAPVTASGAWVDRNHDTLLRYVQAYTDAVAFTHQDPSTAQQILAKYSSQGGSSNAQPFVATLVAALPLDQTPSVDPLAVGLRFAARSTSSAASFDPSLLIDTSLVGQISTQPVAPVS